jgi:hypothetical protein
MHVGVLRALGNASARRCSRGCRHATWPRRGVSVFDSRSRRSGAVWLLATGPASSTPRKVKTDAKPASQPDPAKRTAEIAIATKGSRQSPGCLPFVPASAAPKKSVANAAAAPVSRTRMRAAQANPRVSDGEASAVSTALRMNVRVAPCLLEPKRCRAGAHRKPDSL